MPLCTILANQSNNSFWMTLLVYFALPLAFMPFCIRGSYFAISCESAEKLLSLRDPSDSRWGLRATFWVSARVRLPQCLCLWFFAFACPYLCLTYVWFFLYVVSLHTQCSLDLHEAQSQSRLFFLPIPETRLGGTVNADSGSYYVKGTTFFWVLNASL